MKTSSYIQAAADAQEDSNIVLFDWKRSWEDRETLKAVERQLQGEEVKPTRSSHKRVLRWVVTTLIVIGVVAYFLWRIYLLWRFSVQGA